MKEGKDADTAEEDMAEDTADRDAEDTAEAEAEAEATAVHNEATHRNQ